MPQSTLLRSAASQFALHEEQVERLLSETAVYSISAADLSATNPREAVVVVEGNRRLVRRPATMSHKLWVAWLEAGAGRSVLMNRREVAVTLKTVAVTVLQCWQATTGGGACSLETLVYKMCRQQHDTGQIVCRLADDLLPVRIDDDRLGEDELQAVVEAGAPSFVSAIGTTLVRLRGSCEKISVACRMHNRQWCEPRASLAQDDYIAGGLWMTKPSVVALGVFNTAVKSLISKGVIASITSSSLLHVDRHVAAMISLVPAAPTPTQKYLVITPYRDDCDQLDQCRRTAGVPPTTYKNVVRVCNSSLWTSAGNAGYGRYVAGGETERVAVAVCAAIRFYKENDSVMDPEVNIIWKHAHMYPMQICLHILSAIEELVDCLGDRVSVHILADPFDVAPVLRGVCPWRLGMLDAQILRHPAPGQPAGVSRFHGGDATGPQGRLDEVLRTLASASTGGALEVNDGCMITYDNEQEFAAKSAEARLRLLLANTQVSKNGERDAVVFYAGANRVAGAETSFLTDRPRKSHGKPSAKRQKTTPPQRQKTTPPQRQKTTPPQRPKTTPPHTTNEARHIDSAGQLTLLTHATSIKNAQATRPGAEGDRCIIVPVRADARKVHWYDIYAVLARMPADATLHLIIPPLHLEQLRTQIRSVDVSNALVAYIY